MASRSKRASIQAMKKQVIKKVRPKTFKTEEAANKWAKEQNISKYNLVNMRNEEASTKKIKVVEE
ncbi:hypothetical protein HOK51_09875 [Candidatus Woesearchaeota archaeon]|jgi:hypothetical protein|nr:hypothetical protein [Candidatus Woesearchaeota archaeon]MBT6520131.1 hypothetical protein [Candidatus Woesearchaeota archaeon]MBT7366736.1 hypothetical protein [Candidatus Woesearchaeota archaeon]